MGEFIGTGLRSLQGVRCLKENATGAHPGQGISTHVPERRLARLGSPGRSGCCNGGPGRFFGVRVHSSLRCGMLTASYSYPLHPMTPGEFMPSGEGTRKQVPDSRLRILCKKVPDLFLGIYAA